MFSDDVKNEIAAVARDAGIEPAALMAIAEVESGGRAFAVVKEVSAPLLSGEPPAGSREEPLIRFEGHYFDRLVDASKRAEARARGLASPKAGAVRNPAGQTARWRMLEEAMRLDRAAALQSVSWGIGQVMGSHWKALGYESVEALAAEARSGVAGQVRLMLRFIKVNGLADLLRARDWAAFARAYNGPAYARNHYDRRMEAAYRRYRGGEPAADRTTTGLLRRGDRGERVAALQRMLTAAGHALAADGMFGPATAGAVERFQADCGLVPDGIAGPRTMAALRKALPGRPAPRLAVWLLSWLRRMLPVIVRLARRRTGLCD